MAKSRRASQAGAAPSGSPDDLPPEPEQTKLNPSHQTFARHYARYHNATLAYHYAYPEAKTTSCAAAGSALLRNIEVQAFVTMIQEQDKQNINFTREDYLRVLTEIATDPGSKQRREAANDLCNALALLKDRDDRGGGEIDHRRVLDRARQLTNERKTG